MRILTLLVCAVLMISGIQRLSATQIVFTNDTYVRVFETNYDGADIVVTDCTLTVDGPHSFSSVTVQSGGKLTHSFSPNALLREIVVITNEAHTLNATNSAALALTNVDLSSVIVQNSSASITYSNSVDYELIQPSDGALTIIRTTNSSIPEDSIINVAYQSSITMPIGLNLSVAGDLVIESNAAINLVGKGYDSGLGNGAGKTTGSVPTGTGAGHGGIGGLCASNGPVGVAYGSLTAPSAPGSGGGSGRGAGGPGGGTAQISVGQSLIVDGLISANGVDGQGERSGGGSGGSIWITASRFAGNGVIQACGGAGEPSLGGGGAGGRIAIHFETNSYFGIIAACGGKGFQAGGAGTIFTKSNNQTTGAVTIDNAGRAGAGTLLSGTIFSDLTVQNAATVLPTAFLNVTQLTIRSNSSLILTNQRVNVARDAMIQAGSRICADGTGYTTGYTGPGSGGTFVTNGMYYGGGAGYGGIGAGNQFGLGGGPIYSSAEEPSEMGSAGGKGGLAPAQDGGAGGGALVMDVGGTLTVDGVISANGARGVAQNSGGGSGGTLRLTAGSLSGTGLLTANGGAGNGLGGGGAGGRIAVECGTNDFSGKIQAFGACSGTQAAGAGTIYLKSETSSLKGVEYARTLIFDNGGQTGGITGLNSLEPGADIIITGGAIFRPSYSGMSLSFSNILITSSSWLVLSNQPVTAASARIESGCGILADGTASSGGSGAGRSSSTAGSGAGHGGPGGPGSGVDGGIPYDTHASPMYAGSSGGNAYAYPSMGGKGGGIARLTISGLLQLDGRIFANGTSGNGLGAGGGSGGTVYLDVGSLSGIGTISADGGSGIGSGGGGAGGRIAIYCRNSSPWKSNTFTGPITAYGGPGYGELCASPGSIFIKQASDAVGSLTFDNGGRLGLTNQISSITTGTDLIIGESTPIAFPRYGPFTFGNLTIASNAWLFPSNQTFAAANAVVHAGAHICCDGGGHPGGQGSGAGQVVNGAGSGGGYGGYGVNSKTGAAGGHSYGSATDPYDFGSGGAGGTNYTGAGGGVVRFTVNDTLTLYGNISADGSSGRGSNPGGGSGGSVYLRVGRLKGTGCISANGAPGIGLGGSGGGGRISIISTYSNDFSGAITAYGGTSEAGTAGAGTIFTQANQAYNSARILVDNGGRLGAPTRGFGSPSAKLDLTIRSGGFGVVCQNDSYNISKLFVVSNGWLCISNTSFTAGDATVSQDSGVIADGVGYPGGSGTGAGGTYNSSGGGAGHGGVGAPSAGGAPGGIAYGTFFKETGLGSGGGKGAGSYGYGGSGGGTLSLTVQGILNLHGRISADGLKGPVQGSGGGSGGSVVLNVGTLTGSGNISASGGPGCDIGGGGGGGRISITYKTNAFTGQVKALGAGSGTNVAAAGTIYWERNGQYEPTVIIDNNGQQSFATEINGLPSYGKLVLNPGANAISKASFSLQTLSVSSNACLSISNHTLNITGDATIAKGGRLVADGFGHSSGQGPGAGKNRLNAGGGGGHGGFGANGCTGATGGGSYDSQDFPNLPGSGGGTGHNSGSGGKGGGFIVLTVNGTLDLNGTISACGASASEDGGGGSGGSIQISGGKFMGTGCVYADGGASLIGGGGGGGRIAIRFNTNLFTGRLTAFGGSGFERGGAGTIFIRQNSANLVSLVLDNGGVGGTNTAVTLDKTMTLTVRGGAKAYPSNPSPEVRNLLIGEDGYLSSSQGTNFDLVVFGDASIDAGGCLSMNAKGYAPGAGVGAGLSTNSIGSGAGHGGAGGASSELPGGSAYGAIDQPLHMGSGGAWGWSSFTDGGKGGGAIRLNVAGTLRVDGWLSADGEIATQDNAGGGSGGSIWATANAFAGSGVISANGGAGELYLGGGGAGGRVALYARTNGFTGTVSVSGGDGFCSGETGSIYQSTNLLPFSAVGHTPTGTNSASLSKIDLFFSGAVDFASLSASNISVMAPTGAVSNVDFTRMNSTCVRVSFPSQRAEGSYVVAVAPSVTDIFGQFAQPYAGPLSLSFPVISGTVTSSDGAPLPGVLIQPTGGLAASTTDENGNFSVHVPSDCVVDIVPQKEGLMFVPGLRTYTNITASVSNQTFVALTTIAPTIATTAEAVGLGFTWTGISGVTYFVESSTNLVNWAPCGEPVPGSNVQMQIVLPNAGDSQKFFRVKAKNY